MECRSHLLLVSFKDAEEGHTQKLTEAPERGAFVLPSLGEGDLGLVGFVQVLMTTLLFFHKYVARHFFPSVRYTVKTS